MDQGGRCAFVGAVSFPLSLSLFLLRSSRPLLSPAHTLVSLLPLLCPPQNGQGKSTLANLVTSSLTPTSGTITLHPLLRIGHFSQYSVELLSSSVAGTKITPLEYFLKQFPGTEEGEARACLGGLGLSGRLATGVAVEALSGGQKVSLGSSRMKEPGFESKGLGEGGREDATDQVSI